MSKKSTDTAATKKKPRKNETPSILDNAFIELEIRKFCPKRIFDVILINGNDEESTQTLQEVIESAKEHEETAGVTFVKYEDVLNILDYFDIEIIPENLRLLINHLLEEIRKSFKFLKPENYPAIKLAMLMKIKLIEVMCRHRKRESEKLEKRSVLYEALNSLTKECRKGAKEDKTPQKDKDKKELRVSSGFIEAESDVIFDDDIFNHVWFYVFEGFYNVKVIYQFIYFTRVAITAIIKFQNEKLLHVNYPPSYRKFWNDMNNYLYGHIRSEVLENTLLMQYSVEEEDNVEIFEDLWHVIKSISNIKLQHLNYVRHLQIYELDNDYEFLPIHCLSTYNRIMSNVPLELSNEVVILSSILEECCFRLDDEKISERYSLEEQISKVSIPFSVKTCTDVCNEAPNINAPNGQDSVLKIRQSSFQCYEGDYLSLAINMYKPIGKLVNDLTLNVLKCLRPFYLLNFAYPHTDIIHKHDVDPSCRTLPRASPAMEQFLKLVIIGGIKKDTEEIQRQNVNFEHNLVTYDGAAFQQKMKVVPFDGTSNAKLPIDSSYRPSPFDYYWNEQLPSHVMLQRLRKVQKEFAYMESTYCSEIERLLVYFHDDLDDFGVNTKIFDETICTPVCLRDFCRYIVSSQANWLNTNKPPTYVRKIEESEDCPGTKKIRKLNIFPEYKYLLETKSTPEDDTNKQSFTRKRSLSGDDGTLPLQNHSVKEVSFDEMISELENYPNNRKLIDECSNPEYTDKDFLAYDFAGTKYSCCQGARTIFASHDNVKITVENTKFVEENNKCSVTLKYLNNNLILHSHEMFKDFYSFHWILHDGTIILFELQRSKKKIVKVSDTETIEEGSEETIISPTDIIDDTDVDQMMVNTLDEENLNKIFPNVTKKKTEEEVCSECLEETTPSKNSLEENGPNDIFQGLNEAIKNKLPIYKIHKNFETLKLKKPRDQMPLVNLLQRIMHNTGKILNRFDTADTETSKKFIGSHSPSPNLVIYDAISFRITLPNGIYLTCYPSQIREHLAEVKQEQLASNIKSLRIEEFRLFTREGYVLIKKIDGTITLLMSNGNQIDFEKPDTNKEEIKNSPLKRFHCKTFTDYRKRLNQIMKGSGAENPYYISRRGALETKKGYVINKDIVKILENSKMPYLKTTLINFEGTKTMLHQNKITQKKLYHMVSENDVVKEEICFERKDGLKCVLQKTANRIVEFKDGTRISTAIGTAAELVDGYVYINLYYKYEHPNYMTVSYEEDDMMLVRLNNNVVLEKTVNNIATLKMDLKVTTSVSADEVRFVKKCPDCETPFSCSFNIAPFHTNTLDFANEFVHAEDSYGKHFFVDYSGNCRNNVTYTSGPVNEDNCNHYGRNCYKRLFSLKKSCSGEEFFTNNMVSKMKEDYARGENNTVVERKGGKKQNGNLILELNSKYYESFADRFLTKSVVCTEVALTKYKQAIERPLYYSTNQFLMKGLKVKSVIAMLNSIVRHFKERGMENNLISLFQTFLDEKRQMAKWKERESLEIKNKLLSEIDNKCKCAKERITFAGKIHKWQEECDRYRKLLKENDIPFYFVSDFCQQVRK